MMIPHGILIAFLFTMQHECTHNTPFRSLWLKSAIGHLIAFLLYQPFLWFRFFHLAHHKYTNIAGKDPELDGHEKTKQLGRVFTPSLYLGLLVGQGHNLAREQRWPLTAPYIPPRKRRALRAEAVPLIAAYAVVFAMTPTALLWL